MSILISEYAHYLEASLPKRRMNVEPLPSQLRYAYLKDSSLLVIIYSSLKGNEVTLCLKSLLPFNTNFRTKLYQKVSKEISDYTEKPNYQNILTIENGYFHPDPSIVTTKIFPPNWSFKP
jgi:hypothetical protein